MLVCLCAGVAYLNLRSHQGRFVCRDGQETGGGEREGEREIVDELGAKEKSAQFA